MSSTQRYQASQIAAPDPSPTKPPTFNGTVPKVGNRPLFFWHVQQISAHTGEKPETILRELARENRYYPPQADMANRWNNQIQGANWDAKQKADK